ncbi:O-antigen ligase family protein [Niallia sp. FSL W8-0177]|uniref:O-antigen ligase family protein n=1 Tax=Niallia sp. FSL W8-0177 TaxID=2954522 RepID=UPI0030F730CE
MNFRIKKITSTDLISLVILISCINITFLNSIFSEMTQILFWIRIVAIIGLVIRNFFIRHKYTTTFKWLSVFILFSLLCTQFGYGNVGYAFRLLSIPFLISLCIDSYQKSIIPILRIWKNTLWVIIIADALSMVLYPSGLYSDDLYTENWFLGYKTARLVYSLPLCIITAYLSEVKNKKINIESYLAIIISAICLYHSKSTAANVGILLIGGFFIFFNLSKIIKGSEKIIYKILNYKVFIPLYGLLVTFTILIDRSPIMQYFVVNILGKSPTLTTRTFIWESCLNVISSSPIYGVGYLYAEKYVEITGNVFATSAHNMVLSILVSTGVVGLLLYVAMVISATKRKNGTYQRHEAVLIAGIISLLIVGVTSSTLVFSAFGFAFYILLGIPFKKNM